jgi:epoxyqueuosine reductase
VSLTGEIKAEAQRLGFSLAGVTSPDPPPHWHVYEQWLDQGRQASMAYLADEPARTRRRDPRLILPDCKSILVLAARYPDPGTGGVDPGTGGVFEPAQAPATDGPCGRVAAYAWGTDYHRVLPQRMEALVAFIEARVGRAVAHRAYTDTGPLLERDLAQRAGLGWIGKNTCLINPRRGSYFFLAEILLALELEADPPFLDDRCGTCRRCIDACPTQCILPDRTLDAGGCISYLTIELKESIPTGLRSRIGSWVFGCDACQQVCPWNRFADGPVDPAFSPRQGVPAPAMIAEIDLTPEAFNRKFKDSPVQRARRRGYRRNLAVALGNAGDPASAPALARAAGDPEPLVGESAAWALEQISGNRSAGTGV